jgi:flavin-binding protein dodecin
MRRIRSTAVWTASIAAGVLLLGVAGAQVGRFPAFPTRPDSREDVYEGTSDRGSIQQALDNAVDRAARDLPGADRLVRYRVLDISGEQGGIRGLNVVRVRIELTDESPRPIPPDDGDDGVRSLEADLRVVPQQVRPGDTATFELSVENTGRERVRIPFRTGQQYDFEVLRNGRRVWRWGEGRIFTQALTSLTLQPDQGITFTGRWDLRDNAGLRVLPGRYEVRGYLPSSLPGRPVEATGTITVLPR